MKKFNLLLATTAMLSIGLAMNVNADNLYSDTEVLNVRIHLFNANKITVYDEDVVFGTLVNTGDNDDASVRLNAENGIRTVSGVEAPINNDYNFARIGINIPAGYKVSLTFNDEIYLYNKGKHTQDELEFVPEYHEIGTVTSISDEYNIIDYRIGGSIDLSDASFGGTYTGTFTITAVVSPIL